MARPEVTGRKLSAKIKLVKPDSKPDDDEPPPPRLALTILEFCAAFRISEDFYYKLRRQGQGPRTMKIGARTMISIQAANEWLLEREAEAAKIEA
jgi:hypothetical protein